MKYLRNKEIYKFRLDNPQFSLEAIGKLYPVNGNPLSKQRISKIILREKLASVQLAGMIHHHLSQM